MVSPSPGMEQSVVHVYGIWPLYDLVFQLMLSVERTALHWAATQSKRISVVHKMAVIRARE